MFSFDFWVKFLNIIKGKTLLYKLFDIVLGYFTLKNTGESRSNTVCSKAKIIQARSSDLYLSKRFSEKVGMLLNNST